MSNTKNRILAYDFARGLAIIGMVFVNFKVVMVAETDAFLYQLVDVLSGKAAALFVVLAGVGMTEDTDADPRRPLEIAYRATSLARLRHFGALFEDLEDFAYFHVSILVPVMFRLTGRLATAATLNLF